MSARISIISLRHQKRVRFNGLPHLNTIIQSTYSYGSKHVASFDSTRKDYKKMLIEASCPL